MAVHTASVHEPSGSIVKTLSVIERALIINPEAPTEIRDRGLVYFGLGRYKQSLADLETYLRRLPRAARLPGHQRTTRENRAHHLDVQSA